MHIRLFSALPHGMVDLNKKEDIIKAVLATIKMNNKYIVRVKKKIVIIKNSV